MDEINEMRKSLKHEINTEKLKKILAIKEDYNEGRISLEEGRKYAKEEIGEMYPYEFALAEQELKSVDPDECKKEDIQGMLDLFQDIMNTSRPSLSPNHPIAHYYKENDLMKELLKEVEDLVQYPVIINQWLPLLERMMAYKKHFQRKQNQLYATLERHGFDRPSTTMWLLDDFVRDEMNQALQFVAPEKPLSMEEEASFIALIKQLSHDLQDLMAKEETVLYPTSLALIPEGEFEEMKEGDQEIGFAWLRVDAPANTAKGDSNDDTTIPFHPGMMQDLLSVLSKLGIATTPSKDTPLDVTTGKLTLEQINLIYQYMPVDFTFVDENDIVRFYTDTTHRVFPRSKNIIGRKVENCHPATSVHIVMEIVEKFRNGSEDKAEFWIDTPKKFIYICYFAIRDKEGKFRGILEMMQDCTHIRSLQGSRTLLTWDHEEQSSEEKEEPQDLPSPTPAPQACSSGEDTHRAIREINETTRLKDLLEQYPNLKERMQEISPKFKMLTSPLARVIIPTADISTISKRSGIPTSELIEKIKALISSL